MNALFGLMFLAQAAGPNPLPPTAVPAPAPTAQAAPASASAHAAQAPVAQAPLAGTAVAPVATAAAAAPAVAPQAQQGGGMWQTLIFFGVMILVFWLLIIRPQQKQRKKAETFLSALKAGDKVVTAAGLIGRIVSIDNDVVNLELARDVRVKVVKSQVVSNYKEDGDSKSS